MNFVWKDEAGWGEGGGEGMRIYELSHQSFRLINKIHESEPYFIISLYLGLPDYICLLVQLSIQLVLVYDYMYISHLFSYLVYIVHFSVPRSTRLYLSTCSTVYTISSRI